MEKKSGNILVVGVGGQGTILASDILCAAALEAGLDAKKSEIHGMSQRGGSVFSHVRYGERVHSPVIARGQVDLLIALEEMEAARWTEWLHAGSRLVICGTRILPANISEYPEGIVAELASRYPATRHYAMDLLEKSAGNAKYVNVLVLGIAAQTVAFPDAAWYAALEKLVPAGTFDANRAAFDAGRALA